MGFYFRKRIRLGKGVSLNLGSRGISTSFGFKGFSLNLGRRGVRTTTYLPGTGLGYTSYQRYGSGSGRPFSLWRLIKRIGFVFGVMVIWALLLAAWKGTEWLYQTVVGWFGG